MSEQATNAEPSDSAIAEKLAPTFLEIPVRVRALQCPDCGIAFTMPLDFFMQRVEAKGAIYCPAGHLIHPKLSGADAALETLRLIASVAEVKIENEQLRTVLSRVPRLDAKPVNDRELKRRIRYLANRARHTDYGKAICSLCESQHGTAGALQRHLMREHKSELIALNGDYFV